MHRFSLNSVSISALAIGLSVSYGLHSIPHGEGETKVSSSRSSSNSSLGNDSGSSDNNSSEVFNPFAPTAPFTDPYNDPIYNNVGPANDPIYNNVGPANDPIYNNVDPANDPIYNNTPKPVLGTMGLGEKNQVVFNKQPNQKKPRNYRAAIIDASENQLFFKPRDNSGNRDTSQDENGNNIFEFIPVDSSLSGPKANPKPESKSEVTESKPINNKNANGSSLDRYQTWEGDYTRTVTKSLPGVGCVLDSKLFQEGGIEASLQNAASGYQEVEKNDGKKLVTTRIKPLAERLCEEGEEFEKAVRELLDSLYKGTTQKNLLLLGKIDVTEFDARSGDFNLKTDLMKSQQSQYKKEIENAKTLEIARLKKEKRQKQKSSSDLKKRASGVFGFGNAKQPPESKVGGSVASSSSSDDKSSKIGENTSKSQKDPSKQRITLNSGSSSNRMSISSGLKVDPSQESRYETIPVEDRVTTPQKNTRAYNRMPTVSTDDLAVLAEPRTVSLDNSAEPPTVSLDNSAEPPTDPLDFPAVLKKPLLDQSGNSAEPRSKVSQKRAKSLLLGSIDKLLKSLEMVDEKLENLQKKPKRAEKLSSKKNGILNKLSKKLLEMKYDLMRTESALDPNGESYKGLVASGQLENWKQHLDDVTKMIKDVTKILEDNKIAIPEPETVEPTEVEDENPSLKATFSNTNEEEAERKIRKKTLKKLNKKSAFKARFN